MTKPLTTLGDALMAKGGGGNWRADLRAAEIPRRTPPPSRPDRGYVEQPEERIEAKKPPTTTQFPPRRREETPVLTAPVALIRFSREPEPVAETPATRPPEPEPKPPEPEPEPKPTSPPHPMAGTELNQYDDPPPPKPAIPPLTDAEHQDLFERANNRPVRGKDRKPRVVLSRDQRILAVMRVVHGHEQLKTVGDDYGVSDSSVSLWVQQFRETGEVRVPTHAPGKPTPTQPRETPEETMPRANGKRKQRQILPLDVKIAAVKRIVHGKERAKDVAEEIGALSTNVSRWVQQYKENGTVPGTPGSSSVPVQVGPVSRTMVSNGKARSTAGGPPSIPTDAPPLPTIRVGGFDNPTFELYGLQAYIEYAIRMGVKAELKRRLGDD